MKTVFLYTLTFLCSIYQSAHAQAGYVDSLLSQLASATDKTELLRLNTNIGHYYQDNSNPKAVDYYQQVVELAGELGDTLRVANGHYSMGYSHLINGDYDNALNHYLQSARLYEDLQDSARLVNAWMSVSNIYVENRDFAKTDEYQEKAYQMIVSLQDSFLLCDISTSRGALADMKADYDQALVFYKEAENVARALNDSDRLANVLSNAGLTYKHQKKYVEALSNFETVLRIFGETDTPPYYMSIVYNNIGATHAAMRQYDQAERAFDQSIKYASAASASYILMENYRNLSDMYKEDRNFENHADFLDKYYILKDSLFSADSRNQLIQLEADYQIEQKNTELLKKEAQLAKQRGQRNIFIVATVSIALVLLAMAWFYRRIKGVNRLLEEKNAQIHKQKAALEGTLDNLKKTQAQLIHSEKMASLGELTAGIAHEIKNPLNFVNNFSDVNGELIDELIEEIQEGRYQDALDLAGDIKSNEEKIKHHGERADSIVKGMLMHSRNSSEQKELTDINALCDEYLRLAYHGLKAKDKAFNAALDTRLDDSIEKISVIPQDIGRVLLNLLTNAFHAVADRQKKEIDGYHPEVHIETRNEKESVIIAVSDNGNGIPADVIGKIFQPFFTTKPTGEGTGLGLSMSYDIITKGHGGKLTVHTDEGKGSTFTIELFKNLNL